MLMEFMLGSVPPPNLQTDLNMKQAGMPVPQDYKIVTCIL